MAKNIETLEKQKETELKIQNENWLNKLEKHLKIISYFTNFPEVQKETKTALLTNLVRYENKYINSSVTDKEAYNLEFPDLEKKYKEMKPEIKRDFSKLTN